jgi:hypothetical protein
LLSLPFGFLGLGILDGQTFTHAVTGVFFGAVACTCGLASARKESKPSYRLEGKVLAALGLVLVAVCVLQLPSAYKFQTFFNERSRARRTNVPTAR